MITTAEEILGRLVYGEKWEQLSHVQKVIKLDEIAKSEREAREIDCSALLTIAFNLD